MLLSDKHVYKVTNTITNTDNKKQYLVGFYKLRKQYLVGFFRPRKHYLVGFYWLR